MKVYELIQTYKAYPLRSMNVLSNIHANLLMRYLMCMVDIKSREWHQRKLSETERELEYTQ